MAAGPRPRYGFSAREVCLEPIVEGHRDTCQTPLASRDRALRLARTQPEQAHDLSRHEDPTVSAASRLGEDSEVDDESLSPLAKGTGTIDGHNYSCKPGLLLILGHMAISSYAAVVALHDDEYPIDIDLVRSMVADQFPEWADLPLRELATSGTVNVLFRLGDDKVVRLPRARDFADGPQREFACLPLLASMVPLRIPRHLALGAPTDGYPSHWSVLDWIDGTTADHTTLDDMNGAASALAEFVLALRRAPTDGAPRGGSYRALDLARVDRDMQRWLDRLPDDLERGPLLSVWRTCVAVEAWDGPPTWLHSDLRGDNLIALDGDLTAVIDWEGCSVGDPSADYLAAWWLFDGDSRELFRSAARADTSDWSRAKGWALFMAVAAIPYYADTNPDFAAQARTALSQILADE